MRTSYLTVGLGVFLAVFGVTTALTTARSDALDRVDRDLRAEAGAEASDIEEYFERARSIMLITAQNPSFGAFYAGDVPPAERVAAGGTEVANVADALGYLEQLYPASIGEACFIDLGGAENARVVRGTVAGPDDLSPDESTAAFFASTAALAPGEVYHAAPYVSPDTGEWVISNSTPVTDADGQTTAIVHFEVTMDSFRTELTGDGHDTAIIDAATGDVLAMDDAPQRIGAPLGRPGDERFRALSDGSPPTSMTIDGRRFAVAPIDAGPTNANEWMIAVGAERPMGLMGFGSGQLGLIAFGLLIIATGIYSARAHRARIHQAMTDHLTGLPSRRHFLEAGAAALRGDGATTPSVAILMIDLDRFKEVNDTLGHSKGDELLRAVSARMSGLLEGTAELARLGGDEFGVVVPQHTSLERTMEMALALHDLVDEPFDIGGLLVHVGASIGIAVSPEHGEDLETLLQHADVAMYEAKRLGRAVSVYEAGSDPHSAERLAQVAELRAAVRDRRIELHYQPKVDLLTGLTVGMEALARWTDESGRRVPPDEFIPLAERCGLMGALTELVLDTGLAQLGQWRDAGLDLTLAINISATALLEPTFVSEIAAALRRHAIPPRSVVLELTENAVMDDPARALRVLDELRRTGVGLSIDDFGTGYSSLDYLRRLPVTELKIDRSFVGELTDEVLGDNAAIVRAAIEVGHSLGMSIVAEGVETDVALDRLRDLGCDQAQGYLVSRPVDSAAATDWLMSNPVHVDQTGTDPLAGLHPPMGQSLKSKK